MKRILFGFLVGVAAGAGGYWYFQQGGGRTELERARTAVSTEAARARESVREKIHDLSFTNIADELSHGGTVIREKARSTGQNLADAAANTRITASIKTHLLTEPGLSAFGINVDTTDGIVTLSGKVNTPAQVGQAVKLALETDGVRKVISTLQVGGK